MASEHHTARGESSHHKTRTGRQSTGKAVTDSLPRSSSSIYYFMVDWHALKEVTHTQKRQEEGKRSRARRERERRPREVEVCCCA